MEHVKQNRKTTLILNHSWLPIQIATARVVISHLIRDRIIPLGKDHTPFQSGDWPSFTKEEFENKSFLKDFFYENHPYMCSTNHIWPIPTIVVTGTKFFPKQNLEGKISLRKLAAYYGNRCQICGEKFRTEELTIEHVKPVSKGGTNDFLNVLPTCRKCNNKKSDIHPYYDYDGINLDSKIKKISIFMHIEEKDIREEWKPFLFKI